MQVKTEWEQIKYEGETWDEAEERWRNGDVGL